MAQSDAARVEQAICYLDRHYRDQPTLDDVARAVGLSPYHFQRLFKRWAGVSPKRFLQFLTIDRAKVALSAGRSVLEASWESGLSGPGRLHDLFVTLEAVTPGEFKGRGRGLTIHHGSADSPFGTALIARTDRGICGLAFTGPSNADSALADLRRRWRGARFVADAVAAREMAETIFGDRRPSPSLTLQVRGTNFQIKVWEALLRIPAGALVSYGDLARVVGHPRAHRAVGTAVGQNPVAYLIPCHRVIKSTGAFGSYRWGASRKRAIVGWEAARLTA